ncbi:MAG: HNH endonuclease [Paludibacteraceae bacterium]|nr:HNH endonuclease [Paludibacteraceae bacterium]
MPNSFYFEGVEIRRCPNAKPQHGKAQLYCSADGRFFSITWRSVRQVQHHFSLSTRTPGRYCHNGKRGNAYPSMVNFSNRLCHHLIYETWVGPRTPGMQIDHVNGDILDYRACNLEQVTPSENMRRAKYLRVMRQCEFDPRIFTADDLRKLFAMPFDEFKTMLEHHRLAD